MRGKDPEIKISSIPSLNNMLWGVQRGKIILIAARPSIGKSAFSVQMAVTIATQGFKVMFLSLEMSSKDIIERMFCNVMKVNNKDVARGRKEQYEHLIEPFRSKLTHIPFAISDCIGKDWQEITNILEKMENKPDVIFIDHLNAIRTPGINAKQVIDDYLEGIKEIASHHNITFVMACQINRDNQKDDDKTPQLHELKGTGKLEEIADQVIMLHWPWKYDQNNDNIKNDLVLIVGKNRGGETGIWNINYRPEFYLYSDKKQAAIESKPLIEQPMFND